MIKLRKILISIYFFLIYYFSFFYVAYIKNFHFLNLVSGFKEILILVLVLGSIFIGRGRAFKPKLFFWMVLYSAIFLIAALRTHSVAYTFIDSKYFLIWPLIVFPTVLLIDSEDKYRLLLKHIQICCFALAIIGIIGYHFQMADYIQRRSAFDVYAAKSVLSTSFDFGATMCIAIVANVAEIQLDGINWRKVITIPIFLVAVIQTFTRGSYLFAVIFSLLSLMLFIRKRIGRLLNMIFQPVLMMIIGLFMVYIYQSYKTVSIFSTDSLVDRFEKVWPSFSISPSGLIWGNGLGTVGGSTNGVAMYSVTDNSYLRIVLTFGIVGLAVVVGMLIAFYSASKKEPLIGIVLISVGVTAFFSDYIVFTPAMFMTYCLLAAFYTHMTRNYSQIGGIDNDLTEYE